MTEINSWNETDPLRTIIIGDPTNSYQVPEEFPTKIKSLDKCTNNCPFSTNDIVDSLKKLGKTDIETLDIDDEYYQEVFDRVPNVTEDHQTLQDLNILVDGDEEGYLLQIFTKNVIGPIFIEIIQRKNHHSFGEGNFGALFRSIEKDQQKRGYLK